MLALPLVLFGVLTVPSSANAPAAPQGSATYTVECTFTNPGYVGPCGVTEEVSAKSSPRAACRRILSCLNDVGCIKTYCNATTIRRGWRLVEAKPQAR